MQHNTDNVRIISSAPMVSPNTLIDKLPLSEKAASVVVSSRNAIKNILYGNNTQQNYMVSYNPNNKNVRFNVNLNGLCQDANSKGLVV